LEENRLQRMPHPGISPIFANNICWVIFFDAPNKVIYLCCNYFKGTVMIV
jgi:hypothetical protein